MIIDIDQQHGILLDSEGRVVKRFGNWHIGTHEVPDIVESVAYVDGPAAHERSVHWIYRSGIPPVSLTVSSDQIINDGTDDITVSMTLDADAESNRDVKLLINGESFSETLAPDATTTETITTTASAGTVIDIELNGPDVQQSMTNIEVVSP